ncbi:OadG family protein [Fusobacterium hwasookii]|uniref:OadG family protein n=1 Tax=Fusobacterium hwasookii TaxID=1583098 RepID=UPI00049520AE|nr:OadG family protein [Fusobacterium hwasookii]QNE68217.1 OadG family protein [Fusobacterium hwasookii]
MWTSNTMTFAESIMTFLIGFSIVFIALIALALFIIVSSKVINLLVKEEVPEQKPVANTANVNVNAATKAVVKEDNQEEAERLAAIISAISEEMREPVENFTIVSITEI